MNILESSYVPNFSVIYKYRPYGRVVHVQTLKEYRPITRSSHIIKTMGGIIRKQLVEVQSPNLSNNTQVYQIHYLKNTIKRQCTQTFSKASNKVYHSTLLCKLSKLGIQGDVLSWVRSGVQQGSVMDLILFSHLHLGPLRKQ